jgi:tRNA 2-selenouridine synthase
MIERIEPEEFLQRAATLPVIDVRSPKEFMQGHIPRAENLPLFNDDERVVVGTIYKNSGRDAAILKGFEFAGPRMVDFVKTLIRIAPKKDVLVHCWRGGMRSEQMALLFDLAGFKIALLKGGYKGYRKFIRNDLSRQAHILILGGLTGSGKTETLHALRDRGEQILDLEEIAHHKGSVFGGLGQELQPTNEQFENNLYSQWEKFDFSKIIWIENESRMIGNITIPDPIIEQMTNAHIFLLEVAREKRIHRLIEEYSQFDQEDLKSGILKIAEKLGGTRSKQALIAVDNNDFYTAAGITLDYYDKTYYFATSKKSNNIIYTLSSQEIDPISTAEKISAYMFSMNKEN